MNNGWDQNNQNNQNTQQPNNGWGQSGQTPQGQPNNGWGQSGQNTWGQPNNGQPAYNQYNNNYTNVNAGKSNDLCAILLWLGTFLCGIGSAIERFYLGKIGTGILWLLTGGLFGVGTIIDEVRIMKGTTTDKYGNILPPPSDVIRILCIVHLVLFAIGIIAIIASAVIGTGFGIWSIFEANNAY